MNNRLNYSNRIGERAVKNFTKICKRKNYTIQKANTKQDIYEHWDWKILSPQSTSFVDLKAIKDNDPNITYLEFIGISGYDGWLCGRSTHIVFEQEEGFIYLKTPDLLNWALKKVGIKDLNEIRTYYKSFYDDVGNMIKTPNFMPGFNYFTKNKSESLYKLYSRSPYQGKPRHDVMTKVLIKDMKKDLNYWNFV